jgi:hypothetical protein
MNRIPQLPAAHPQNHLEALAKYCATMCEIECCGLDACDFSPVHIASYCLSRDVRYPSRVAMEIIEQAKTLKKKLWIKWRECARHYNRRNQRAHDGSES